MCVRADPRMWSVVIDNRQGELSKTLQNIDLYEKETHFYTSIVKFQVSEKSYKTNETTLTDEQI